MKKIDLPRFSERIRGFTLPKDGIMYVFDYDEVFQLELETASIELLDEDPYAFAEAHSDFLGVSDNKPLLGNGNSTVSYTFEPVRQAQTIRVTVQGHRHEMQFRTLSGDWFVATLAPDERYLIIAEPYRIEVYALLA